MTHRNIKIGVTVLVLGLAFGGLLWVTLRDGTEYFKNVNEVMSNRQAWEGKDLQLHGHVGPGSVYRSRSDSLEWRFQVQNDPPQGASAGSGTLVNVSYNGIVPDTFKPEAEVVLRGRLSAEGFQVMPNGVTAKCPSKYEEKQQVRATAGS